jgi:hypothetical protein
VMEWISWNSDVKSKSTDIEFEVHSCIYIVVLNDQVQINPLFES